MTSELSKKIGGNQLLKSTALFIIIVELVFLNITTKQNLIYEKANFINSHFTITYLLAIIPILSIMYFLGRFAGFYLLFKMKNHHLITFIFTFSSTLILTLGLALYMSYVQKNSNPSIGFGSINLFNSIPNAFAYLLLPNLIIWFFSVIRMKTKYNKL